MPEDERGLSKEEISEENVAAEVGVSGQQGGLGLLIVSLSVEGFVISPLQRFPSLLLQPIREAVAATSMDEANDGKSQTRRARSNEETVTSQESQDVESQPEVLGKVHEDAEYQTSSYEQARRGLCDFFGVIAHLPISCEEQLWCVARRASGTADRNCVAVLD